RYNTGTELAAAMATAMNAVANGNTYAVTYNANHTFTITRASGSNSFIMKLTGTTATLATELGFTGDVTGAGTPPSATFQQVAAGDSDLFRTDCAAGSPNPPPAFIQPIFASFGGTATTNLCQSFIGDSTFTENSVEHYKM